MVELTKIFLIRHGETEYNRQGIIQGHVDSDLTDQGQAQAQALGKRLATTEVDLFFHSGMPRAAETARLAAEHTDASLHADPRLKEIGCGIAEGRHWQDVKGQHPETYARWQSEENGFAFPEGETFNAVQDRMYAAVRDIAQRHAGKHIAIVSHGMALRLFIKKVLGSPLGATNTRWYWRNTAVARVHFDGQGFIVLSFGDVAHLGEL